MDFFDMGIQEIAVVLIVALLVLGPVKMMDVAKTMGKFIGELRRATSEIPKLLSMEEEGKPKEPPLPPRQQLPEHASPGTDENADTSQEEK